MSKPLLAALLLWSNCALGVGTIPNSPVKQDTSSLRYANDLDSADANIRLYAARVLRNRVKEAWRIGNRESTDIRVMEARQTLSDFDHMVAPRCMRLLDTRNVAGPCARILGLLETKAAMTPLERLLASEPALCVRHAARKALKRIEGAQ